VLVQIRSKSAPARRHVTQRMFDEGPEPNGVLGQMNWRHRTQQEAMGGNAHGRVHTDVITLGRCQEGQLPKHHGEYRRQEVRRSIHEARRSLCPRIAQPSAVDG
jgi:Spy/CpxP family protein refolding chaperone